MKLILQQLGFDLHDLQGVADILGDAKGRLLVARQLDWVLIMTACL
jgi:hypothetical protein